VDLTSAIFFLLFLPLTLALFGATGRRAQAAKITLLIVSVAYYALADWTALPLLFGSIALNYLLGIALSRQLTPIRREGAARVLLLAGIVANLGLLAWFKYGGFLIDGFSAPIPLGMSFFTFQQVIYLVDVYRDEPPAGRPLDYALFVAFFPKVTAGPFIRHGSFLAQLQSARLPWDFSTFNFGVALTTIGLTKKLLLAGMMAPYADRVFDAAAAGTAPALLDAWAGSTAYALQLYFDFSGYSDMAIGIAAMFGLRLPFNFNSPYRATSVSEFWKRWHITLSSVLFEFIYFPIAASAPRGSVAGGYAAVLITMLACGIWHGAGLSFVVWGLMHGVFLCVHRGWQAWRGRRPRPTSVVQQIPGVALTFVCVLLAWTFFRAPDLGTGWRMFAGMLGASGVGPLVLFPGVSGIAAGAGALAAGLALIWLAPNSQQWAGWAAQLGGPEPAADVTAAREPGLPLTRPQRVRRLAAWAVGAPALVLTILLFADWAFNRFVFASVRVVDCTASLTPRTLTLRPGCHGEMYSPDYGTVPYETNGLGLRDQEYDPALYRRGGSARRVMVLGNSFTFGAGVAVDQAYHAVLEQRRPELVMFNAGFTVGIEGVHDVAAHYAPLLEPDLALLTIGTADVLQLGDAAAPPTVPAASAADPRPLATVRSVVKDYLVPQNLILVLKGMTSETWLDLYRVSLDADTAGRYDRFAAVVTQIRDTLARQQPPIPLVVVIIPQIEQANGFVNGRAGLSPTVSSQHLATRLAAANITTLDSVPFFLARGDAARLYYPRDRHFTAAGQAALADFLQTQLPQLDAATANQNR
jgi:alginate O-acetyltransferase complex protein AlgI